MSAVQLPLDLIVRDRVGLCHGRLCFDGREWLLDARPDVMGRLARMNPHWMRGRKGQNSHSMLVVPNTMEAGADLLWVAHSRWLDDPHSQALRFKPVEANPGVWSVRINRNYRALGVREGELIIWFWIGDHDEYLRILKRG